MGVAHNREGFDNPHGQAEARVSQLGAWRTDPWTMLRYQLVLENILRHLPAAKALRVLDVGSGDAFFAIEMAKRGCFVEMVDTEARTLEIAQHNIVTEGMAERVRVSRTISADLSGYRSASFNLILCHRLFEYTLGYERGLAEVTRLLKPGGLLSVVYANCYFEPLRLALKELDPWAALTELITHQSGAGPPCPPNTPEPARVNAAITATGLQIVADYSVGIFNDYASDNQRQYEPGYFAALLELERAAALLPQYQGVAQYRHILATRS